MVRREGGIGCKGRERRVQREEGFGYKGRGREGFGERKGRI